MTYKREIDPAVWEQVRQVLLRDEAKRKERRETLAAIGLVILCAIILVVLVLLIPGMDIVIVQLFGGA